MSTHIVSTSNLTYNYTKGTTTLHGIDLQVNRGDIYGFLGPNGSGKTTTLSLLLGLLKNQKGEITFFGKDFSKHRQEILRRVGSLVETPSVYGHLTAHENLEVYREMYGGTKERVHEVLCLVSLQDTGDKPVRKFSLGMKQRLAIAIALLPRPRLIILDEPTNGLDPSGIIELRALVRKLNSEEDITFIISSHILSEVEKMVNRVGIIYKGNMIFEGDLKRLYELQHQQARIFLQTSDNDMAMTLLVSVNPEKIEDHIVFNFRNKEQIAILNRLLVEANIDVYSIHPEKQSLEQLFINLTSEQA